MRPDLSRRSFLKWSAVVGAGAATGVLASSGNDLLVSTASADKAATPITVTPHVCAMNCGGGSCVLNLEVQDGVVTRIDTDQQDLPWSPAQRGCQRGRSMRQQLYHPDRLKQPMKRVGKRGEGKFEPITWDEAYTTIAQNLDRIIKKYGNQAIFYHYASGVLTPVFKSWPTGIVNRLLNQLGGYLNYYGTYSSACYAFANPYTLGNGGNNSADDMVNSRLILIFADNPAETRLGGGGQYQWYLKAKQAGAKVIVFDPRLSDTAKAIADEWIPIRPTTDNALINALAYVMITENLHDQAFLDKYCVGFDESHLPAGAPAKSSFKSYILGDADGVPKTPQWAEPITGVPAATIVRLAREIAGTKPCCMIQGLGWQRHAYGEQPVRALPTLAAMTGNIGIKGGGNGTRPGGKSSIGMTSFPLGTNPVKASISCFQWPDAITHGTELRAKDGLRGVEKLDSNIKMIWNYAGNTLINQHGEINHAKKILADESLVEFIVVHDIFMTPSAKFADILLPDRSSFERTEMGRDATSQGDRLYYTPAAIDPLYDTRDVYEVCLRIAEKLGVADKFSEGRTMEQWQQWMVEDTRKKNPTFPTFDELKKNPVIKSKQTPPTIGMSTFIADPEKNKLSTQSGKIEIYSAQLAKMGQDWGVANELPPIPKYVPAWEGPQADPALLAKYPLQLIGHHVKRRVHSTHDNNPWMEEVEQQAITLNEIDAAERGIKDGDMVKVWNDRGIIHVPCRVSKSIMPGVADLPQGAWHTPNKDGVDIRGAINTITKYHPTPGAKGNPQHTNLVQVAKL
ncbi:MAG TPA: DMSO/selenate family reductase complex A subunit [Symbiobacteriaceae bacterium]|nr:DMSO/selenate family reductase complex A subunit [Symbiobacteriaceae bacterium]